MYLNKYDIKGETYVKLDELNDLIASERKAIARKMKQRHADGKDNGGWAMAHSQLTDLRRKVNMSEGGESYVIFTRDQNGEWEYLVDVIEYDKLPIYVKKYVDKTKDPWVTFGTSELEEATLYDTYEEAEQELKRVVELTGSKDWHMTRKWMFDIKENHEALRRLFWDKNKPDEKAEVIKQAEGAIERTRTAIDKAEKLLEGLKEGESEKPSEVAKKPSKREASCPARYTVWYRTDEDTTQHCMGFVRFEKGIPVYTNRPCKATWFTWRGMAEKVAERCGEGFEVVDMINQMTAEERLLRAIFREDGMDGEDVEPEYHGDGTRAEDEDWEDE